MYLLLQHLQTFKQSNYFCFYIRQQCASLLKPQKNLRQSGRQTHWQALYHVRAASPWPLKAKIVTIPRPLRGIPSLQRMFVSYTMLAPP